MGGRPLSARSAEQQCSMGGSSSSLTVFDGDWKTSASPKVCPNRPGWGKLKLKDGKIYTSDGGVNQITSVNPFSARYQGGDHKWMYTISTDNKRLYAFTDGGYCGEYTKTGK